MILIFSTTKDQATMLVTLNLKEKYYRINTDIDHTELRMSLTSAKTNFVFDINYGSVLINLDSVSKIWYRRGKGICDSYIEEIDKTCRPFFEENLTVVNECFFQAKGNIILGSYHKEKYLNKLDNLRLASVCGLPIPPSLVTSCNEQLNQFLKSNLKVITKPIKHPISFRNKNRITTPSSGVLIITDSKTFSQKFPLTLFQKYIEKKFELRIFFIEGWFYTAAFFSQLNEDSKIDYRDGNPLKIRTVPFRLPTEVKEKIVKFMQKAELTTGSIDMIVDKENQFYFLEVNPSGQFLSMSEACNFYIERKIANYLEYDA